MPLSPGTRLGRYEVVRLLGAGGMGEVYLANDTQLDRSVAITVEVGHGGAIPPGGIFKHRHREQIAGPRGPHAEAGENRRQQEFP